MTENGFNGYGLDEKLIEALGMLGYTQPTEIQKKVIPYALKGRDIIASSKTGSGKTAAFAVPVCQSVEWDENAAQALVLEPTRELAFQVRDEIFNIGRMKRLKVPVLYGGFPIEKQVITLRQKSHIVVGTPGRILDHCRRETLSLEKLKYVIIDEADLMLDMGFINDVRQILSYIEKKPVIMLFSATMEPEIKELTQDFMTDPEEIILESDTRTVDSIEQMGYYVDEDTKFDVFEKVIMHENPKSCIIFCATREMVEVLYYKLKKEKIESGMLHGLIDQKVRTRTIEDFRTGVFRYLIATDVAARGVDFDGITHVFNYDLPTSRETYVHRIGRTGRNKASGRAVSMIKPEEMKLLKTIEKFTGVKLEICNENQGEPQFLYDEALQEEERRTFLKEQRRKHERKRKKGDVFNNQIMKLTIGGGRKSKIRSGDVVGAISQIEGIDGKADIGVIDIRDSITYVEILNSKGDKVIEELSKRTLKGKIRKVRKSR